ncbi:3-deoxy-7-phosphoheptulonate synthase [Pseudoleptotrichia goodfellowii]|uniref:Phospho-2-dehydro-3-deoxyheptonate aldolase n=1 Tax=Pseudoleptotrichia goodfellowii TaxID=157692 RepID=A0A510JF60_9FUSO|nr:3-deoxy-7-phosphoheptulonate synthase [Pseudoleptotrichia goodfellowii]BBM36885.1 phospho-2-dehydro-3-deoxyheptonate aldolase [Pseudoleptotrichia goodfellowii]
MIIKVDGNVSLETLKKMIARLESENKVKVELIKGEEYLVLGLVGDISTIDIKHIQSLDYVMDVQRIQEPYKRASRKFKIDDTIVKVGNVEIGGNNLVMMAGPCSVESEEQILTTAKAVKKAGANILRGGVVKPRTSPYAFQGLGMEGIELMKKAKEETGMPIICEVMSIEQLHEFGPHLDMIQIGARNMQNFDLLKEVGKTKIPVLLKRGLSATIEEWLMSAEYILAGGNENIVLCERGIRTYETAYRNVMDLNAVPMIKKLTHLPIIVDSAHGTGKHWMVKPLAMAGIAAGADGLMVEVHPEPDKAFSDGPQSLKPEVFEDLMKDVEKIANVLGKSFK